MVFFYRRFLPLDVYKYAFWAQNDAFLTEVRSPHGSGVINTIHYRSAASLPQICLSPLSNLKRLSQILNLRQPLFDEIIDMRIQNRL